MSSFDLEKYRELFLNGKSRIVRSADVRRDGIVLIVVDDLFSVEHHRTQFGIPIHTPNLDRLMARGTVFSNAFCSIALCNPSRTTIFTGQNQFKTGVHFNYDDWTKTVPPEATLFYKMKESGRRTFSVGKTMHSEDLNKTSVSDYIDFAFSAQWSRKEDQADPNNLPVAADLIQALPDDPYFFAIGITDPHAPFLPRDFFREIYPISEIEVPTWDKTDPPAWVLPWLRNEMFTQYASDGRLQRYIQGYLANVSNMDFTLGVILNAFKAEGHDPTIVLTSDHGYVLGAHDHIGKFTLWDDAARVPLVVVDPSNDARTSRVDTVVSSLDIFPTLLDYAGISIPSGIDGQTLRPATRGGKLAKRAGAITTMFGSASIRTDDHRFTRYEDGHEEFFDVANDPHNTVNLAATEACKLEAAALRDRLRDTLSTWVTESTNWSVLMTPKSAEKELKRVIDLEWIVKDSRRSHVLYASHAKALLETEDFSAAMQAIEKSLARKPDRADGARHLLRFQIMLGLGLHDEIIAALDELQVTTELPGRFCLVLGRALENQGNKARARNVYEDMIKSDRSAVGAQRRLRAMERVEVSS